MFCKQSRAGKSHRFENLKNFKSLRHDPVPDPAWGERSGDCESIMSEVSRFE
jgi:hypothetical protein